MLHLKTISVFEAQPNTESTELLHSAVRLIPPGNSTVVSAERKLQRTLPEWKVWLKARTEVDLIFIPTAEQLNFQLIFPKGAPSVLAKYTYNHRTSKVKYLNQLHLNTSKCVL